MGESAKSVLGLVLIVSIFGAALTWMIDDMTTLAVRVAFPVVAVVSSGALLWAMRRVDKAPDLLAQVTTRRFERDGFCFALVPRVDDGRCFLDLYFQSRFEGPSRAAVVLKPSKGFFLTRPDLPYVTLGVDCPPAGFGMAQVPWAVPGPLQGKVQSLDVAADVSYPKGRGKMIRYGDGLAVGKAKVESWKVALTVAGALGGQVVLSKPAQIRFKLPTGVFETVPDDAPIVTKVLWQLGDPEPTASVSGSFSQA